jgi:plastocyanin
MKKVSALLVLVFVSALVLAACGSSSDDTTGETTSSGSESGQAAGGAESGAASATALKFEAPPGTELAYTTKSATAKAGEVTVEFDNKQAISHDVAIEDSSGKTIGETELVSNGSATTEVELEPGTYTFYCTVPGHREAGMEGTLTVK